MYSNNFKKAPLPAEPHPRTSISQGMPNTTPSTIAPPIKAPMRQAVVGARISLVRPRPQ